MRRIISINLPNNVVSNGISVRNSEPYPSTSSQKTSQEVANIADVTDYLLQPK